MYPGTSLVKPTEMSSLHLSLAPAKHTGSVNVSRWSWSGLFLQRKQETSTHYPLCFTEPETVKLAS